MPIYLGDFFMSKLSFFANAPIVHILEIRRRRRAE
jgi:hypothetical protein